MSVTAVKQSKRAFPLYAGVDCMVSQSRGGASAASMILAVLALATVFFLAEQSLHPVHESPSMTQVSQGPSLSRQIGIVMAGCLGSLMLVAPRGIRLGLGSVEAKLIVAFCVLCVLSVFWSDDLVFTLRRLASAVLCFLCVLGICRRFRPAELCFLTLLVCLAFLFLSILVEVSGNGFRMTSARYRFGGAVHPNMQGAYCSLICLASICLQRSSGRKRWLYRAVFCIGLVFLVLTGSRTACYAFFGAGGALWWISSTPRVRTLTITAVPVGLMLLIVVYEIVVGTSADGFLGFIAMGRDVNSMSTMTSRTPVWNELMRAISEQPLFGYGYQSYWSGDRSLEMTGRAGWGAESAHNAYLETILSIGLVGGALQVFAVLAGALRSRQLYLRTANAGYGFIFAVLMFGSIHSMAESTFSKPLFPCIVFVTGLAMIAFQHHDPDQSDAFNGRPLKRAEKSEAGEQSSAFC